MRVKYEYLITYYYQNVYAFGCVCPSLVNIHMTLGLLLLEKAVACNNQASTRAPVPTDGRIAMEGGVVSMIGMQK